MRDDMTEKVAEEERERRIRRIDEMTKWLQENGHLKFTEHEIVWQSRDLQLGSDSPFVELPPGNTTGMTSYICPRTAHWEPEPKYESRPIKFREFL